MQKKILKYLSQYKGVKFKGVTPEEAVYEITADNLPEEVRAVVKIPQNAKIYEARIWDGIGKPDFDVNILVSRRNNTDNRWYFIATTKTDIALVFYKRRYYGMSDTAKLVTTLKG